MKRALALLLTAFVLLLAACGGSSSTPGGNDNGNGGGSSAEASTEASVDAQPSEDTGGGGGGGGSVADVQQLAQDLVPPNSSQISQTSAEGTIWTTYESTDSVESLKSHYEGAIANTGMHVYSTSNVQDTYSWLFAENDSGSGFGGSVTVAPSGTGSGSSVIVLVTNGQ